MERSFPEWGMAGKEEVVIGMKAPGHGVKKT
jgi:hypothetical protein